MRYVVGVDEAGYGPNLGPLVITATVWQLHDEVTDDDLYARLRGIVTDAPERGETWRDGGRLVLADSKSLYHARGGLGELEPGVLVAAAQLDNRPRTWSDLCTRLDCANVLDGDAPPWHAEFDAPLPVANEPALLDAAEDRLRAGLARAEIRLASIHSRVVFPREFNRRVQATRSKGTALSELTLDLLGEAVSRLDAPVIAICDKHGGRGYYGPLLQRQFPDWLVRPRREGRMESEYHLGPSDAPAVVYFRAKAEQYLSVALASMTSKYLRELAMQAFNEFWMARVHDLRPTAGYPGDARRFKREIAGAQSRLGIADGVLWRTR